MSKKISSQEKNKEKRIKELRAQLQSLMTEWKHLEKEGDVLRADIQSFLDKHKMEQTLHKIVSQKDE